MPPVAAALVLGAALLTSAQAPAGPAPALPAIDTSTLPPETAKAIESAYAQAVREPRNPAVVGRLAVVLHAWELWEPAADVYRLAQKLAPDEYRWWHLAGLLETRRGRHDAAVALFERAAATAPNEATVRLRLAEAKLETGDLDGSQRLFSELAGRHATAAAAEYGLGRVAMARGDLEKAIGHFERAVAAFPDFGAAHYGRALALRRLGREREANDALERQRRCLPCWPATGDALAESVAAARDDAGAMLKRGMALAREGQERAAIEAHQRAVAMDPSLVQARINLITLYARAGDLARAEAEYREAVRLGAQVGEAHAAYGQALLAERRPDEAAAAFRAALSLTPADAAAWNGLGLALEQSGDSRGASDAYRQATVHAPALRAARFNYARTLVGAGRLAEAIVELEKLLSPEDAETPRYRFALAAALVRAGSVDRGRTEALAALELARRYQQTELAATIERDLALLR